MYGQAATGGGREPTICGYQGVGLFRRDPPHCGSKDTGRRVVGWMWIPGHGSKQQAQQPNYISRMRRLVPN
jgi:hypothetical protein